MRILYTSILILTFSFCFTAQGQNIVSTSPQNKTAVLEEFGGIYCVYCPEGHQVISELSDALEDNLVLLNYHTGYYAIPLGNDLDLRSDFGEEIMLQTELSGFPAATINRRNFPGYEQNIDGSTAMGRADWHVGIEEVLQEQSPVNIAAEATLNIATRELEVYIEYYYTADALGETNRLNAAIVQNNVLSPQHGGGQGNYYPHQNIVRDFLTGQWGHIINNTNTGSFGSLTYNYTLPIDYRGVLVDPFNIKLAIFIGEDQQNIFTGIEITPELVSAFTNDVNLLSIYASDDICENELNASLLVRNDGNQVLESMEIIYHVAGEPESYFSWTGSLAPLEETIVQLPTLLLPISSGHYDFVAQLTHPNTETDPTDFNNIRVHYFCIAPTIPTFNIELALKTDDFGYEIYWEIVDDFDVIHASGGNVIVGETNGGAQIATPTDPNIYPNNSFFIENIELPENGCYHLRVLDDYGDGLCCEYGIGFFKLRELGQTAFIEGAAFGALDVHFFAIGQEVVATSDVFIADKIKLYPNPVSIGQEIQVTFPENTSFQWQLFSLHGQLISEGNQFLLPQTNILAAGYYILRVQSEDIQKSLSFIVSETN